MTFTGIIHVQLLDIDIDLNVLFSFHVQCIITCMLYTIAIHSYEYNYTSSLPGN